jgi:hypothetical protein
VKIGALTPEEKREILTQNRRRLKVQLAAVKKLDAGKAPGKRGRTPHTLAERRSRLRVEIALSDPKVPNREKAHWAAQEAVRCGLLVPAPCCEAPECNVRRVLAHHVAYEPAWWLRVIWLCNRCHTQLHCSHGVGAKLLTRKAERRLFHRSVKSLDKGTT